MRITGQLAEKLIALFEISYLAQHAQIKYE